MRLFPLFPALVVMAAVLSGCEQKPLYVDQAVIHLSPNPETPSAGYFTIHAGAEPVTLRSVMADAIGRIEMHDNVMKNGMMTMVPMDSVDVPAGGTVEFAPGGRHLMLWTVDPGAASTGKITLKLYFSNGETLLVDAAVEKTGQAPVRHEGDHH